MVGLVPQHGGLMGARHCLPQERVSLASWMAPLANVWKVLRGASKLTSRAQLTVSLGTRGPVCISIPSRLVPGGAEAALWATLEQDESREAVSGCPQRPGPWPCFETCF